VVVGLSLQPEGVSLKRDWTWPAKTEGAEQGRLRLLTEN
jgi:hypothetical protein